MSEFKLNRVEEAIAEIRAGKVIIVVDDEDRENEGDFIAAAEKVTPEMVNFMATYGRGLLCAPLPEIRCAELELDLMVNQNTAAYETAFTVSVDLLGHGCSTGISAHDRAKTILRLVDKKAKASDFGRPGHIFPLRAKTKGVLRRPGHTEAAVDLSILAGCQPGGVLIEIMNEDGSMARLPELIKIAEKFKLKIISIKDLIEYMLSFESLVIKGVKVNLPTDYGDFHLIPFIQKSSGMEHLAIVKGEWTKDEAVLVRVHSSCITGDIFGSHRCDCGQQLHAALRMINKQGKGVLVYLNQEGRGIGLFNKIKAYQLQEQGIDTVQANIDLGFKPDERDYGVGASILRELGLGKIKLLTNNPKKRKGLEGYGLQVIENISIEAAPNKHNQFYLQTKKEKMGHFLNLVHFDKNKSTED